MLEAKSRKLSAGIPWTDYRPSPTTISKNNRNHLFTENLAVCRPEMDRFTSFDSSHRYRETAKRNALKLTFLHSNFNSFHVFFTLFYFITFFFLQISLYNTWNNIWVPRSQLFPLEFRTKYRIFAILSSSDYAGVS